MHLARGAENFAHRPEKKGRLIFAALQHSRAGMRKQNRLASLRRLGLWSGAMFALAAHTSAQADIGQASFYGRELAGRKTASGEIFRPDGMTAAHRNLPFGTRLKVTNLANGRSVILRINDRGPFVRSRLIDVSQGAARMLGFANAGTARVRIERMGASTVPTASIEVKAPLRTATPKLEPAEDLPGGTVLRNPEASGQ
jgi:rare lipoprotein A (peptidoglycan hydrolase)